jgi:hypothetical protein
MRNTAVPVAAPAAQAKSAVAVAAFAPQARARALTAARIYSRMLAIAVPATTLVPALKRAQPANAKQAALRPSISVIVRALTGVRAHGIAVPVTPIARMAKSARRATVSAHQDTTVARTPVSIWITTKITADAAGSAVRPRKPAVRDTAHAQPEACSVAAPVSTSIATPHIAEAAAHSARMTRYAQGARARKVAPRVRASAVRPALTPS